MDGTTTNRDILGLKKDICLNGRDLWYNSLNSVTTKLSVP